MQSVSQDNNQIQLKEYKELHTPNKKLGGEHYNILKMTRAQRASYAFDKKDPLAQFSEEDNKSGNLAIS